MAEEGRRSKLDERPRSATEREWETFVRESESDPLRHVGSVTAPTAEIAHEQASTLFERFATDIWVCPATEVSRFSTETLADDSEEPERGDDLEVDAAPEGGCPR